MAIDRTNFLLIAGALAVGGGAGWVYRDREAGITREAQANAIQAEKENKLTRPVAVSVVDSRVPVAAACDDSQGTPEECPSVGPSDEGICPDVILKRCQEFKASFEPRVAAQAVACLRALKPGERCDVARVNQCGHLALMSACPEPAPPAKAELKNKPGNEQPTVTIAFDANAPVSPEAAACESILKRCGSGPLTPTLADCRQTLAGLNDLGRTSMIECVTAHCTDRGLYGCEATPKASSVARTN